VPAAAVKRMGLVLFILTGRKGSVGGDLYRRKKTGGNPFFILDFIT